ncbi:hypothetical protein [Candidatus Entotheonella palauensis]|uniref:hypothetical protein n=1 Tax=Candidatus Entotheonella palauensis TaxID=93172 RepID=UPI0004B383A6|nr:hypothetical protein [Candidatus Entotheonella palauensis]
MSEPTTIVVVAIIALDENDLADIPEEFEELSAYELGMRRRVGRVVPSPVLICVDSQDELKELMDGIEGMDVTLDLMTDDRTKPKPETLDDLWAVLPSAPTSPPVDTPNLDDPFRILPDGPLAPPANPPEDDNPFQIL